MSPTGLPPMRLWRRRTVSAVVLAMFAFMWLVMQLIARAATATPPVFCGLAVLVAWWASKGDPEARGVHRLTVWACLAILIVSAAFSVALLASTSTSEVTITPGG